MLKHFQNPVRTAVSRAGGATKVSNLLGIANSTVHRWIKNHRVGDIDFARKLAELAEMKLQELRPTR